MLPRLKTLLLAAIFAAATAGPARADLLGDTLKPFASVTEMYDSNVFRVRDREQLKAQFGDDRLGDFITVAAVGTAVRYRVSRQEFNLHLQRDFIRFGHYSDQDVDRDEGNGALSLSLFDAVRIRLDGAYVNSPEPRTDYRSAGVNKRRNMEGGVSAGYEMTSGVGFEAVYRRLTVDYSLPQYRTSEHAIDRYAGTVSYRLSPEARLYATYQRDETEYTEALTIGPTSVNKSNSADFFRIGLDKTFSPKTAVSCSLGYLNRRYGASSARDFSGMVGKAAITYGVTEKLGFMLNGERQLYEETYAERIYSVNDSVGARFVYRISEKVRGTVFDRLSWKDFRDVPGSGVARRSDFTQEVNAGIEWDPVTRLTVSAGYQYAKRSSDDPTFDYSDHTLMTGVAYRY